MRNKSFQLKSEKCFGGKHITNWGSNYKLAQQLLQNRAAITSWNKCITKWCRYYKLEQLLQIGAKQMKLTIH